MPKTLTSIFHQLTPPVVWEFARSIAKKHSNTGTSGVKPLGEIAKKQSNTGTQAVKPLGEEKPAEYYNQFGANDHFKSHYTASKYYPTWLMITDHMLKSGSQKILDIGCGPGQFAKILIDNGFSDYTGIDFSEARIGHAKQICPQLSFICKDVFEIGLIESLNYDTVVMTEFLEHITEDTQVFRRLKPGTKIFGTVPNFGGSSHVRKFETPADLHERYGGLVDHLEVKTIPLNEHGSALQLFEGTRSHQS